MVGNYFDTQKGNGQWHSLTPFLAARNALRHLRQRQYGDEVTSEVTNQVTSARQGSWR